jgi:hypothetical protein
MTLARFAQLAIVCAAAALLPVDQATADEPPPPPPPSSSNVSPALIGMTPGTQATQASQSHRKLWIALGVLSGAAVVGAIVAVGVTIGTASHDNSVFNDWGSVTVMRR